MPLQYTIKSISEIVGGELLQLHQNTIITQLNTDSRKVVTAEESLFFALKGERNSGHRYIPELYERGVRSFVISEDVDVKKFPEANFLRVENTLNALQRLCAAHRDRYNISVTGITGSNGKTIVKEWLYQLLREDKNIVRSPKSYNSQIGVPLSVWQIKPEHELGIFEAGISQPGEMRSLAGIIKPTIGIITNIGEAHSENFKNLGEKVQEKLELFNTCETIVYCKDYLIIDESINRDPHLQSKKLFTWSRRTRANLQVSRITKTNFDTEIQAVYKNDFIKIKIPFTDEASIENAIHCWTALLYLGMNNKVINERMAFLSPVEMRLELKEGINNCSIINDSYNSDLGSLAIALDFLNQQKQHEKRTLILSDILQSGRDEVSLYKEVSGLIAKKGITKIIGIGEAISRQAGQFNTEKLFFNDTQHFLSSFRHDLFQNEIVLIKGARMFGFEQISQAMQQKAHETVLEINLNAIINNLNYYRTKIKPETKIMAMVKAFSYGSGSYEIANVLQFHRVDYLAVAYADEGVELRKAGIHLPIMVMNPEVQSYDAMIHYRLEPEIFSIRILNLFEETVKRHSERLKQPLSVHIKLDTGMHRLGFEEKDLNELIIRIKNNRNLVIKSIFSHLAGSDEHEHDEFTRAQVSLFKKMSEQIMKHFDYPVLRHILNSAGIVRFPEAQFDMVRLGIGLYGVGTNDYEQSLLQNVSTLKTTISQVKHIPKGETIGYSRKGKAETDIEIATVPIGYADGLSRKLSNGRGKMLVKGRFAHIIGNVCMDMCMIDITGINAKEGDEVVVFGSEHPITEIAKELGTIPYEVLTNVSRRVKRVYYQE